MRFLASFLLIVILAGLLIRFSLQPAWLAWIGHLPGDLTIRKGAIVIYLPLTSSLLASLLISLVSSLLFHSKES